MRHSLYIIIFITLALFPAALHAQGDSTALRSVEGTVIDLETGEVLSGATVRVFTIGGDGTRAATRYGDITDANGAFTIQLPPAVPGGPAYEAEGSFIGYGNGREPIGDGEVVIFLSPEQKLTPTVNVTAVRRTRSVEDACCRVESIRDEVQQHAPFSPAVSDVLRRYSSCTSTRISCAIDHSASIRLRGLEPTYIKVLVDGVPAMSGLSTFYGLSMIPAHALQTIRISEGASSGLYGNGAISGVVDLETRPPTEMPELTLSGNLTGHGMELPGERDLNVGYTGLINDIGIAAFASINSHAADALSGGLTNDYQRISGLVKGNVMVDNATELTVMLLGGQERRNGSYTPLGASIYNENLTLNRFDLTVRGARTMGDDAEMTFAAFVSLFDADGSYGSSRLDAIQQTAYGLWRYAFNAGDHGLTVGAELRNDTLRERSSDLGIGYNNTIFSSFVQDEIALGDRWALLGSARIDHHVSAGTLVSPRGSIRYEPVENMTMRLMAGQGFKGEALFDEEHLTLHGTYRWRRNEEFRYEKAFTLNYDVSYSFLIGDKIGVDANFNAYHTTIDGKAVAHRDSLAAGTLFFVNSDQPARLIGTEIQLRPTFGEHWSGSLAAQLISYTLRQADGTYRQMPLAPRINIDASLMYRDDHTGLTAEAWGNYIGAQRLPENETGLTESTSYALLNARVEKSFGAFSIYAGVLNLLDATQTRTMPVVFETRASEYNGGLVWGSLEGRELFFGARLTLTGAAE